jgi:hypothetical protein
MPILTGTEQVIQQAKNLDELKVALIQMVKVINDLYDSRINQRGDVRFVDGGGPVVRRTGDGVYVRIGISGSGSSTMSFTELGKTLPR